MIMMCEGRFTKCNKCATLVGLLIMRETTQDGRRGIWGISMLSCPFYCESKIALKISLKKQTNMNHIFSAVRSQTKHKTLIITESYQKHLRPKGPFRKAVQVIMALWEKVRSVEGPCNGRAQKLSANIHSQKGDSP